jgi:hypothetical protein
MKDRSAWLHGALAVLASVLAWIAWRAPEATEEKEEVVILDAGPVAGLRFHEERYDIEVDTRRITVRKTDDVAKVYPLSERGAEVLASFSPLKGVRSLGKLAGERLKELGLESPEGTVTLLSGGKETVLQVGDATYGTGNRYVLAADGTVSLVQATLLSSLRHGAAALQDKSVLGVKPTDVERVVIEAGSRRREAVQRNRESEKEAFFADPGAPDQKLETLTNWMDRVLKLRIMDVGQPAPEGAATLRVTFHHGGAASAVALFAATDDSATATVDGDRFAGPVRLSKVNVDTILSDLDAVFADGGA